MKNLIYGRNKFKTIPAGLTKTAHPELDTLRGPLPGGIFLFKLNGLDIVIKYF